MTKQVDPTDMLVVAAVAREGGFTQAARALGLSKQGVSARVSRLEEMLGVRLLERTTRRVRTTEAGARYVERCSAIATEMEAANREVQQTQAEPSGLLRVSAPFLYGRRFLGPVVASFMKQWPRVTVELALSDRRVDLLEEGVDVAIRVGDLDDSTLVARSLGHAHVRHVASPALLRRLGAVTPRNLATLPLVGLRAQETWHVGGRGVKVRPVLVVNDLEMVCDAAVAGLGLARLPTLVCAEPLRTGRLRVLFQGSPDEVRPVYALTPGRRFMPPRVRLFLDALQTLSGQLALAPSRGRPRTSGGRSRPSEPSIHPRHVED